MEKLKAWVFLMWRPIVAFLAIGLVIGVIFGFRLGSLPPGTSRPEQAYLGSVASGRQLLDNPLYGLHKVPVYALFKLHAHSIAVYRAVSVLFASLAAVSCFFILREWYSDRVAILGTWLFLTSAWILHIGRLALPDVIYLSILPFLWAAIWLYNTTLRKTALAVLSCMVAICFYTPGFCFLVIMVAVWQHSLVWKELKQVPVWFRLVCALIILVLLIPLVRVGIKAPRELLAVGGLPAHVPHLTAILKNFWNIPAYLFLKGPSDPVRWLGRLPLLDIFSIAMLALGLYSTRYHLKLVRIKLLAGSTLLLVVLITLGGPVSITALLPVIYIFIAGGIAFMLQQWFSVFPYNPIARGIATTLMSITVLLVSYYHINHYFIAWPQTPATRASFRQSLIK
ncbi:MAG TPA: hypothetical protein VLE74_01710 [Candidatus Saccharimonadales bacterium]|nr:hypothetical protein [Candidatus Saccharimonadales bacterium]